MSGDKVSSPSHYTQWAIQPINFIMKNSMEFWRGNIIKYAARAGSKTYDGLTEAESEITDLEKCIQYCTYRINILEGQQPNE